MGVAWVFETDKSERSIELMFEQAGAIPPSTSKHFKVDCLWYKPQQQISHLINGFYVIHHSNFPDSAFIINAPLSHRLKAELLERPPYNTFSTSGWNGYFRFFSKGTIVEIYAASNIVIQCQALYRKLLNFFFSDSKSKPEIIQKAEYPTRQLYCY
ncbi:hypothetical protein Mgra_00009931 [Meloidogyne graminicola]|uniref:Uncharacterized protein n=1 Tax=Meloidogyne graminicola TaxID=189291 RepID=A0A8S9ZD57_9BILA|nr:hypothetical protein Mgra_00009931 [Meloidogyne graminicola]